MTLKQRLKKEGYSIYKLSWLLAKDKKEKDRNEKMLERTFSNPELTVEEKNRFKDYFRKRKLGHLLDDDDFKVIYLERYKIK